jgi:hypothetical protein
MERVSQITSIEPEDLRWFDPQTNRASIVQKMSWASWRSTTRLEDDAYALLGTFEINMPLIYGEGRKAFFRLQE